MEWYLYNKFERSSFSRYGYLTDSKKMLELAVGSETLSEEEKNAYRALNLFIRSYAFMRLRWRWGIYLVRKP